MNENTTKYDKNKVRENLSDNLKTIVKDSEKNQKDFSEMMGISPATLSLYMNGKQLPTIDFLISLKEKYPYISIDKLLFEEIPSIKGEEIAGEYNDINTEIHKFKGSYFLCYLNTSNSSNRETDSGFEDNANLKWGVLYISDRLNVYGSPTFKCVLLLGINSQDEASKLKNSIDEYSKYEEIYNYASTNYYQKVYWGEFEIKRTHESVYIRRISDDKDTALILLHSLISKKDYYYGGVGTVNSMSTGKETDPVVQKIVLSRMVINVSEEQIRNSLLFAKPKLDIRNMPETNNLLQYVKEVYLPGNTTYSKLKDQEKEILFRSYLEFFARIVVENNQLQYGRVDRDQDDFWYHMIINTDTDQNS